jgi:hypothetical protein
MRDAGVSDPSDVRYVQTKTPLLTIAGIVVVEISWHYSSVTV